MLHWVPSPCGAMVTEELVVFCTGHPSGEQNDGFVLQEPEDGEYDKHLFAGMILQNSILSVFFFFSLT